MEVERVPENAARIEQQQLGKCFVIVRDRGSLVINKGLEPLRKFVSCLGYRLPTLADTNGAQRLRNRFQAVRRFPSSRIFRSENFVNFEKDGKQSSSMRVSLE